VQAPPARASAPEAGGPSTTYGERRKLVLEAPSDYEGPKRYTLSFNVGAVKFYEPDAAATQDADGKTIASQFDSWPTAFRLQVGRQIHDQFQVQLDLGLISDTAYATSVTDDSTSGTKVSLKIYPLALGLAYRFDYFQEQPVVPYVAAGLQGALSVLKDLSAAADDASINHREGAYVGGGLEILLDTFEPSRASDLELSSGINDTYLVIDARYNWLQKYFSDGGLTDDIAAGNSDVLLFNGFQITAGLKFDF
jgi:hypothetical protein